MIDCIGNDWVGKQIVSDLRKEKVLTDYMIIKNGTTSSLTSIIVREIDGERTIIYSPGNSGALSEMILMMI